MNDFTADQLQIQPSESPEPALWQNVRSITLAHEHNVQCFDVLHALVRNQAREKLPSFVLHNYELFNHLSQEARHRAAEHPFIIADVHFQNIAWLRRVTDHPTATSSNDPPPCNHFPPSLGEDLLLDTLLFARQTARDNVDTAKLIFGMSDAVAGHLASLTLSQVRAIASHNPQHLRIRFDRQPTFWRRLLIAAKYEDITALETLRHQAKRLFFGEVLQGREPQ